MAVKIKKPYVEFVGMSASGVTGSAYLIKFGEHQVLVDYGLYQSNNMVEDYKVNKNRHKSIKPKNIDAIVLTHEHSDHIGKIPELYKNGCTAPLFIPKNSSALIKLMLTDSAKIMATESEQLTMKQGIKASPLYTYEDIETTMYYAVECDFDKEIIVNDSISFTYYNARHIPNSAQILFEMNDGVNIKKLGFTGDIGSPTMPCRYLGDFKPLDSVDVLIAEATYSDNKRKHSVKDRPKDVDKLHTLISTAIEKRAKVLIPVFSLARMQFVLTNLYEMYGNSLEIPVIIDSPLATKINAMWGDMVECDDELWYKVINWSNIKVAHEYNDSKYFQELDEPMIVLSSGGMLSAGRSVGWARKLVNNSKHYICFCGFAGVNTLAHQIKNQSQHPYVKVDGVKMKNSCNVGILNSFSSHMCYDELLEYYTTVQYNKIILTHSEDKSKVKFAEELRKRLSLADRSSKVICSVQDMKCYF